YHHPDQAFGGDLPRESLLRCVLRHIPRGGQPTQATRVPRTSGNAIGQRAHAGLARAESELIESIPNRSAAVLHLRPGSRLHSRAARTQRRSHGPVPPFLPPAPHPPPPVLPPIEPPP